jgi:FMN phosphatase YigB (HAD superfamily)
MERGIVRDRPEFVSVWAEERERQFREEVPELRETDISQRAVRVLARLRDMPPPAPAARWDDAAAAALVQPSEVASVLDAYTAGFLNCMVPVTDAASTIERLASRGFALAILSNWPLAVTIDRFAEAHGWTPFLRAIVVSQRVGVIKPHPQIFRAAEEALGFGSAGTAGSADDIAGGAILHVGDDWAADVVGASSAGWRTAYLRDRQGDTPLPTSSRDEAAEDPAGRAIVPDLELDELSELDALVQLAEPPVLAR